MRKGNQSGAVLVLTAILLPILVVATAMVVDFGYGYWQKSKLQSAADAAALAGAAAAIQGYDTRTRLVTESEVSKDTPYRARFKVTELARVNAEKLVNRNLPTEKPTADTELWVKSDPAAIDQDVVYYCKVELTEQIAFRIAGLILPESLLPRNWTVKAYAWARSEALPPGSNPSLFDQLYAAEMRETYAVYYDMRDYFMTRGYSEGQARTEADKLSILGADTGQQPWVKFDVDGLSRSQDLKLDGSKRANSKFMFIDFKPDIKINGGDPPLSENWDVDQTVDDTLAEAREYYNTRKMRFHDGILPDGTRIDNQSWDGLARIVAKYLNLTTQAVQPIVKEMVETRVKNTISITNKYEVRQLDSLAASEVSYNVAKQLNRKDPLFAHIESEEFNGEDKGNYYTNSVHQITIVNQADNYAGNADNMTDNVGYREYDDLDENYVTRPLIFFYDGPEDVNKETGANSTRESQVLTFELQADFRGILFAPYSPVKIIGNGHRFRGCIVAKSILDKDGNVLNYEMPENEKVDGATDILQNFPARVGFSEARYDTFGLVKLRNYANPAKDVIYLTPRSKITD